jgi:hypothetical protein
VQGSLEKGDVSLKPLFGFHLDILLNQGLDHGTFGKVDLKVYRETNRAVGDGFDDPAIFHCETIGSRNALYVRGILEGRPQGTKALEALLPTGFSF